MRWDPRQYSRYADERSRPFVELVARVGADEPRTIVDLGCGPGELTATLAERWPGAQIVGIDSSPDMIEVASAHGSGRVSFELGDVSTWTPAAPVDVVVANAVFQWVPGHLDVIRGVVDRLPADGWFAFQVPDNFTEPSHTLLRDVRLSPRWRDRLGDGADRTAGVERPETYLSALVEAGLDADVWQTSYLHVLPGEDAVLEWVKGTALRPVLSMLDDDAERSVFLAEYGARLREAYPRQEFGTLFPFRRTFAVAHRPVAA